MTTPESGSLIQALTAAQAEFPKIDRDQEADTGKYTYRYASLSKVIDAVRPVLAKHGLSFAHRTSGELDQVTTILRHVSGEKDEVTLPLLYTGQMQQLGSAITYARRYGLQMVLGIAPDDDDDGQNTGKPKARSKGKSSAKPEQQDPPPTSSAPWPPSDRIDSTRSVEELMKMLKEAHGYKRLTDDSTAYSEFLSHATQHADKLLRDFDSLATPESVDVVKQLIDAHRSQLESGSIQ